MKRTLNLPDGTVVMNIAIVYHKYLDTLCASKLLDSNDLHDGASFGFDMVQAPGEQEEAKDDG